MVLIFIYSTSLYRSFSPLLNAYDTLIGFIFVGYTNLAYFLSYSGSNLEALILSSVVIGCLSRILIYGIAYMIFNL